MTEIAVSVKMQSGRFAGSFLRVMYRSLTAQSNTEIDADMRRQNSWVVVDESGRRYFRYEALVALAASSRLFSSFVPLFSRSIVKKIDERIYRLIAEHRSLAVSGDYRKYQKTAIV